MPKRFLRRTVEDEEFWLDLEAGRFYSVNETGAAILAAWREGARTPEELVEKLTAGFQVSAADARSSVDAFLADAKSRGLLDA